jgi:RND family efflux transporter MFP subunit
MRTICGFASVVFLALIATGVGAPPTTEETAFEVVGKTQCIIGRRSIIAPVVLHSVEEVRIAPGDRVKKGQVLIKLDADEAEADVRAKEAALENAQITLKEARRYLEASEKVFATGALPHQKFHEARVAVLKGEADERSAKAALDSSKAELEHYTMTATTDGVVGELSVHPGSVPWPGRTVWGEILDLSEIDVRCEVTVDQADRVEVGQKAEVRKHGQKELCAVGRVVYVGLRADETSGLTPIHVRVANAEYRLRCGVPVQVRILEAGSGPKK